ncbi:MAG: GGDEF domain-containing protein [Magnetovibrio sp.]|nr:GGDEF domain-containing protein [Magnetovibrio sp.]
MKHLRNYLTVIGIVVVSVLFITYQFLNFEARGEYELFSLLSEGLIALMSLTGIFVIQRLRNARAVYAPLMAGFTLLFFSLITDTLDEVLVPPDIVTTTFEDLFQVLGYLSVVFGLWRWVSFNQCRNEQLSLLASTDYLTGAYNRRHFGDALRKEVDRAVRYDTPFSLISFDLDLFKNINDTYGHDVGDLVLKTVVQLVDSHIRTADIFARMGGEEFQILAPTTNIEGAKDIANKLRASLEQNVVKSVGNVTASFGVTEFKPKENIEDMLKRVDRALYNAKQSGRNCVIVAA